jgi:hypothetical protein
MYNPYFSTPRPQSGIRFVRNIQEANSCLIPPGTQAIFMNQNVDKFYLKETDYNNFSTVTEYEFKKVEYPKKDDFITKEEFEKWKEQYESIIRQVQSSAEPNGTVDAISKADLSATSQTTDDANVADGESLYSRF